MTATPVPAGFFVDALQSTDRSRFLRAYELAPAASLDQLEQELVPLIREGVATVARSALEIAAAVPLVAAAAAAFARLDDPDELVRAAAIVLLRKVRAPGALEAIARRLLDDPSRVVRAAAGRSVSRWGDGSPTENLTEHLGAPDETVRAAACLAAIQQGGKKLVPRLLRRIADDIPLVASAALRAFDVRGGATAQAQAAVSARADASEVLRLVTRWQDRT